jgi:integrase
MALIKRGDVWHFDITVNGIRIRETTGFKAKADAQRYVDEYRRKAVLGTTSGRLAPTLGQVADQWFASRVKGKKSATTTAHRIKICFQHIDPSMIITTIGSREIEDALTRRRAVMVGRNRKVPKLPTDSTVNRDMIDTTLRPILNYAKRVLELAVREIDWSRLRLQEPKERVRAFTEQDLIAHSAALPAHYRALRDFMTRYPVRLSEAFFPPEAVSPESNEIFLRHRKNGLDHTLVIHPDHMAELAALKARAQAAGLATIWFREWKQHIVPLTARGYQNASKLAWQAIGIHDARPAHDFRHHAATKMMRAGAGIKIVQAQLGHEDIASTARYAHADKADIANALRHMYDTKTVAKNKKENRIK